MGSGLDDLQPPPGVSWKKSKAKKKQVGVPYTLRGVRVLDYIYSYVITIYMLCYYIVNKLNGTTKSVAVLQLLLASQQVVLNKL